MKILYAIQGTGNGHLSRARDIIPHLQRSHQVDLLISGTQADVELPYPVKYRFKGLGFIFGKNGGIDLLETYQRNHLKQLFLEVSNLPVEDYDLVINDFEPVSAWACKLKEVNCISVSHQAAVLNKEAPQPKDRDRLGKAILKNYAPAKAKYGFHFKAYDQKIFTPVIRQQIRELPIEDKGHYTVYLPAYADAKIIKVLEQLPQVQWEVFSKHNREVIHEANITVQPIDNEAFIKSMASATGVLCGAGFETPAEALFLKKKLMVIAMKGQYEQHCNAAALKEMGVPVLKSLKMKNIEKIRQWVEGTEVVEVDYPDQTAQIIDQIISNHSVAREVDPQALERTPLDFKNFTRRILKKITPL